MSRQNRMMGAVRQTEGENEKEGGVRKGLQEKDVRLKEGCKGLSRKGMIIGVGR